MECMEGGNDASRIEVLKLIILSLMFVFFVDILACFIILSNVSSFLFYLFVCLCACFLNSLKVIPLFCTAHPLLRIILRHPRWRRFFPAALTRQCLT